MPIKYILILFTVLLTNYAHAQNNIGFEHCLTGWQIEGSQSNISIDKSNAHQGVSCVRIGGEYGGIYRHVPVLPFAVVQFNAYIKSSARGVKGYSFVRFYNSKHKKLLEYKSNALDSVNYQQTGNYTEAPPFSSYMEIGIERDSSGKGYVYADDFNIQNNVGVPKIKHKPTVNLDQYMRPFWSSDTIYNETVLLYSSNGKPVAGRLLFKPMHILSVRSFDLKATFKAVKDYTLSGNEITRVPNSAMPFRVDTSFDTKKDLAWFNTQSQWVVVTYTHHDKWAGITPTYKGNQLPNTIAKLKAKRLVKIVAYGMSITRGLNISSYDTVPPYMPTYVDLLTRQLRKAYHYQDITMYNAGLPGATVDWGAQYADKYVNPLRPDLVIIDFGMNDFWRLTPDQFKDYIKTIMRKIRASNPKVEFLLLSNMKFDPDYVLDSDKYKPFYTGNLEGYSQVQQPMEKKGVISLDMYAISGAIYHQKKAKDCISNPLHPNDYLARWYAQALAASLIPPFNY